MSNDELSLDDMRSALAKWLAGLDGRQQNKRNIAGLLEAAFQRIDALKTRVEVLDVAFANSHQLNESLGDENRALLARVEAAEAEVVDLHRQLAEMAAAMEEIEDERLALLARVAELEAQAAQGWRPGSETPKHDWYLVYDFSEDDQPLFRYYGPAGWRLSGDRVIPNWYMPIPPLPPAPQEPTP